MILGQAAAGGFSPTALIFPALMILVMYFLLIRPQQQQAKKAASFRDALKVGDRVISAGGLFGTIAKLDAATVELEVAPKVTIKLLRSQVVAHQANAQPATDVSEARPGA